MQKTSKAETTAPNHAPTGIHQDKIFKEKRITTQTPAPEEMPNRNGLANGLRSIPWSMAPETPNAEPVSKAASERGKRISRMTRTAVSEEGEPEK